MYDYIKGKIEELSAAYAVLEAAGVGYYVNISLQTFSQMENNKGAECKLFIHQVIREDAQLLYGFFSKAEREVFRLLIGVSGVGVGTARMILSTFSWEEVSSIIATGQADVLKSVKGLGAKTSQKIIVELRDKMGGIGNGEMILGTTQNGSGVDSTLYQEALGALTMLGFAKSASEKVIASIIKNNPQIVLEDLIRLALKSL